MVLLSFVLAGVMVWALGELLPWPELALGHRIGCDWLQVCMCNGRWANAGRLTARLPRILYLLVVL